MSHVVPHFECKREESGHSCARDRGHRGGHECSCGQVFSYYQTRPVPPHATAGWTPEDDFQLKLLCVLGDPETWPEGEGHHHQPACPLHADWRAGAPCACVPGVSFSADPL